MVASIATLPTANNNNIKKFAFLSQETVPDYRPLNNVSSDILPKSLELFWYLLQEVKL
jgi:hypothetical protein